MSMTRLRKSNTTHQISRDLRIFDLVSLHQLQRLLRQVERKTDDSVEVTDEIVSGADEHMLPLACDSDIAVDLEKEMGH